LEKVLHGEVPTLAGTPAVAAADRVIHRALAKSAAERYASAAAMAEDLRTALVADGSESHRGARPVTRLMVLPFRLLRPDAEIDFLAFSLADAVTNSLSPLESLVVRSTLAAARFASDAPDLRAIADEAQIDVVLTGTLLRVGEVLRVSARLLEAPSGTVLWSHSAQVALGDIFQLQDTLARQIVESLALPLSGRERRAFGHDVPSNAKAYEFYLRANPLSHESGSWEAARDLYLQCLQADPHYAPAWARLGRVYHVIGKYRGTPEDYTRSEAALNRALELNPDLSIADRFYAQLEVGDLGRADEAMVRLVRRALSRGSDPELFAALVPACRYCGLLRHSLAAHERAVRLDPNIRTSVQHTFFMLGDYLRAADAAGRSWSHGSAWATALACADHPDAARAFEIEKERYANTPFGHVGLSTITPPCVAARSGGGTGCLRLSRSRGGFASPALGTSIAPSRFSRTWWAGVSIRTTRSGTTRGSIPCGAVRISPRFWKSLDTTTRRPSHRLSTREERRCSELKGNRRKIPLPQTCSQIDRSTWFPVTAKSGFS
jgi:TolB-like protein